MIEKPPQHEDLLAQVEGARLVLSQHGSHEARAALGQYFTPAPLARQMAALLRCEQPDIHILDPGAGAGVLFAAAVEVLCARPKPPRSITVTACEIDEQLADYVRATFERCALRCADVGVRFRGQLIVGDFFTYALQQLDTMFAVDAPAFQVAILNPPYRKLQTASRERLLLRKAGIETSNFYTGFAALAVKLLQPGGDLIAITPRSFCNGPYFRPFRSLLLQESSLHTFQLFAERTTAFRDDAILQENVVFAATKQVPQSAEVTVMTLAGVDDPLPIVQRVPFTTLVRPDDPELFISLVPDEDGQQVAARMHGLPMTLATLGLAVSTGRVVDFRAREHLRSEPVPDSVPLIYPTHCSNGQVIWPKPGKKPNALAHSAQTRDLLVPNEPYVLVRRLTAKEERRRVVATVYLPEAAPGPAVGFENHLNYIHAQGRGLDRTLARGLAAFLNSTLVDSYVRQFNGHTQINATDLRSLRYPSEAQLLRLGALVPHDAPQAVIDTIVTQEVFGMEATPDPTLGQRRIQEALAILKALGLPRQQQNERSALTLLALLDLPPAQPWAEATAPLRGITPMMEFFERHYGKRYAPNTRETVRRQTVHQFVEAGFVVENPDKPDRPVNSPKAVYQIEASMVELLKQYGTPAWEAALPTYLGTVQTLKQRYARERREQYIPISLPDGVSLDLTPGGQNVLIAEILRAFLPQFVPGGDVLYIGDAGDKFALFRQDELAELGVQIDQHGKMPDVVLFDRTRRWLFLVEAVTSHGPIDGKRRDELRRLFANATVGLIYVTAFLHRAALKKYLGDISWETEVWVADAPSHLIHFDGERFLGPYDER